MHAKALVKNPYFWGVVIGIVSLHFFRELSYMRRYAPPPLVAASVWTLENVEGEAVTSKVFLGKLAIANVLSPKNSPEKNAQIRDALFEVAKRFKPNDPIRFMTFITGDVAFKNAAVKETQWSAELPEHMMLVADDEFVKKHFNAKITSELILFDQDGNLRARSGIENLNLASLVSAANYLLESLGDA